MAAHLAPETLEEPCRVAEVLPILFKDETSTGSVAGVRAQVKKMLLESISPNDDEIVTRKLCESERDPQSISWNSNGLPVVPESLAALYDWEVRHTPH